MGILQKIDQTIEDLILLKSKGADGLTITASGQQLPLHCAGTELIKLIDICLALINEKNSLLLIDAIESGFHYSMYGTVWSVPDIPSAGSLTVRLLQPSRVTNLFR